MKEIVEHNNKFFVRYTDKKNNVTLTKLLCKAEDVEGIESMNDLKLNTGDYGDYYTIIRKYKVVKVLS